MKKNKNFLLDRYNHAEVESGLYDFWLKEDLFSSEKLKGKPPFTIVLPPPNVTGKLHIGHALNGTLQDILIRYKRLTGHCISWIPGMDHAGIATQNKVEAKLREQNIFKEDIGREKFNQEIWKWKDEYSANIRKQWAKMGLALDYKRERFTLDDESNAAVNKVFIDMYNDKLIYRGKRIINWDPKQETAISNVEVVYKEVKGKMYTFKYFLLNDDQNFISVSTTRPETMFADVAIVVHPEDDRYKEMIDKTVINPANGQAIPVIADTYVDRDFGTGAMKVTPAHDINDFEIGKRHNLESPICFYKNGKINNLGHQYEGLDRMDARKQLVDDLSSKGKIVSIVDHIHQVGHSERSQAIVEPYLSNQWFVDMKKFASSIIEHSKSPEAVKFYPERFMGELLRWMENVHDWCISRQLWWGHQIPVWYNGDQIKVQVDSPGKDWIQDQDVLDTWFSSSLWPFSALGWPNNDTAIKEHFPTNVLVTGYDIIFFWVSRMYFQALNIIKEKPFEKVLIHGLVRDEQGRKMSKSLGNGVDPMAVIEKHGSDALRYFLVTSSTPGQDMRYSEEKIISNGVFINKIWNIAKFISLHMETKRLKTLSEISLTEIDKWILNKLNDTITKVNECFEKFDFVILGKVIKQFIVNDFANWYLELSKVNLNKMHKNNNAITVLHYCLNAILVIIHPIMPFVSERIFLSLNEDKNSILEETWPQVTEQYKLNYIDVLFNVIKKIREIRSEQKISKKIHLSCFISNFNYLNIYLNEINDYLIKMVNVTIAEKSLINDETKKSITKSFDDIAINLLVDKKLLNNAANNLIKDIAKIKSEISRSEKILNNESFIKKANPEKIAKEKEKYENYLKQHKMLEERLSNNKK